MGGLLACLDLVAGSVGAGAPGPFNVTGALLVGVSAYNPSCGAQPDNSGLALMRCAAHLDVELLGRHLVVPLDITVFSDGTARGLRKDAPSELDVVGGLLSAWEDPGLSPRDAQPTAPWTTGTARAAAAGAPGAAADGQSLRLHRVPSPAPPSPVGCAHWPAP
jgi:hypothetical protein